MVREMSTFFEYLWSGLRIMGWVVTAFVLMIWISFSALIYYIKGRFCNEITNKSNNQSNI